MESINNLTVETVEHILESAGGYLDDVANDYGEPGYTKDKNNPILLANWNVLTCRNDNKEYRLIMDAIESQFDIEWSDEWIQDYDEGLIYRTTGDCWSWKPSYIIMDSSELITVNNVELYIDEYLDYLINNPNVCDLFDLDLSKYGFKQLNEEEFESGWYHKSDNPSEILEGLLKQYPSSEFIFGGLSNEQFRTNFNIYIK